MGKYTEKLNGQKVVVIGGSSGIGYAVAEAALDYGAYVYIASSQSSRVEKAVSDLSSDRVQGRAIDLSSDSDVESFFKWVDEQGNARGIDHLVFTSGDSLVLDPFLGTDIKKFESIGEVRLFGAMRCAQKVYPLMKSKGRHASITFTSGTVSLKPPKGWGGMAWVGAAEESASRGLAIDLAPVRVNTICPGAIDTPLWAGMSPEEKEKMFEGMRKGMLTGEIGKAEEVAEAYLYVMKGGFTTGTSIVVDGGALIAP